MYFDNVRDYSVKIGHYKKVSDALKSYYFRSLLSTQGHCRSEYRHRTKCFKVNYTPFTLRQVKIVKHRIYFDKRDVITEKGPYCETNSDTVLVLSKLKK